MQIFFRVLLTLFTYRVSSNIGFISTLIKNLPFIHKTANAEFIDALSKLKGIITGIIIALFPLRS